MTDELILEAARLHRDGLPGDARAAVDRLLEEARRGRPVGDSLLAVLRQYDAPRQWLKDKDTEQSGHLRHHGILGNDDNVAVRGYDEMTEVEQRAFEDSLDFTGEEPMAIATTFRDGRSYDWDPSLRATVETTPSGRRFVVGLREGSLVRVRELTPLNPAMAQ